MKKPKNSHIFLSNKRFHVATKKNRKNNKRNRRRNKLRERYIARNPELARKYRSGFPAAKKYTSKEINMLSEANELGTSSTQSLRVKLPERFSIISNPVDSLKPIYKIANAVHGNKVKTLYLDYYDVKEIDLAAETISDVIVSQLKKVFKSRHRVLNIKGCFPEDDIIERYLRAIGFVDHLDVKHERLKPIEEIPLRKFQMRRKKAFVETGTGSMDYKGKAVKEFVDHINTCLADIDRELSAEGINELGIYTGEILSNAEEHSGDDDWAIVGYLDSTRDVPLCEIAIFNFGQTIAESFNVLDKDSYAYATIMPYINKHHKKQLFGKTWTIENLITLVAMQGNISSKNVDSSSTRGQGTVQLIEFFQDVYSECSRKTKACAKMAIFSGNTHILFDGSYRIHPDESGRNIIAFNKSNDLSEKPDEKYITNTGDSFFPGTVISISFPMVGIQKANMAATL